MQAHLFTINPLSVHVDSQFAKTVKAVGCSPVVIDTSRYMND